MKAGRELDAVVHEEIFGKCGHYLIREEFLDVEDSGWVCKKCDKVINDYTCIGLGYDHIMLPHYSIIIADAWKIINMAGYYEINTNKYLDKTYASLRIGSAWGKAYADTAEQAICLAALNARGYEEK